MGRRVLDDHALARYVLPRGSVVVVSPWLLHRDERWWTEPEAFRLARWTDEATSARPRHAFLPFGGGPRMCIGEGFAQMEGELLIATIARRWRFELDADQQIAPQPVVTLRPKHGMRMRVVARRR
jgi:cytochrome P450